MVVTVVVFFGSALLLSNPAEKSWAFLVILLLPKMTTSQWRQNFVVPFRIDRECRRQAVR